MKLYFSMPFVVINFCPGTCTDTPGFICSGRPGPRKFRLSTEKEGSALSSGKGFASAFHHVLVRKPTHVKEAAKIPEAMAVIGMKISFKPM